MLCISVVYIYTCVITSVEPPAEHQMWIMSSGQLFVKSIREMMMMILVINVGGIWYVWKWGILSIKLFNVV